MSDSVRPHRQQPTRLLHPWDSPGKNTGVGCHFLLQCMKGKRESHTILSDPMDCSILDSSIHGIFQARVLEWGASSLSVMSNSLRPHGLQHTRPPYPSLGYQPFKESPSSYFLEYLGGSSTKTYGIPVL